MSTSTEYLENAQFRAGYNAAALGERCPQNACADFARGFRQFGADEDRSENQRFA